MDFKIQAPFEPAGDQPQAIEKLAEGVEKGLRTQVLLGATGTGKTYTIAQVINKVRKPTLVIAHNKTLAAQNALTVNRLAEAQRKHHIIIFLRCAQAVNAGNTRHDDNVPAFEQRTRRAMAQLINLVVNRSILLNIRIRLGNIGLRLIIIVIRNKIFHRILREERLQLTRQLCRQRFIMRNHQRRLAHLIDYLRNRIRLARTRCCIYGLGAPQEYYDMVLSLRLGQIIDRQKILHKLVEIQYTRNDIDFKRGTFRVRGDYLTDNQADQLELCYIDLADDSMYVAPKETLTCALASFMSMLLLMRNTSAFANLT